MQSVHAIVDAETVALRARDRRDDTRPADENKPNAREENEGLQKRAGWIMKIGRPVFLPEAGVVQW
ncbi:MAG: hypothetical protein FJ404_19440 [Verrucomicrobia bacterium]|nr:hypothetical protein [Verrucomicrobiota bacterium]